MNSQRRRLLFMGGSAVFASALGVGCSKKAPPPAPMDPAPGFWVWHRGSDFTPVERAALAASGGGRIYRQIGEFGWQAGKWSPRPVAGGGAEELTEVIPVLRLDAGRATLETPGAAQAVARWLRFHRPEQAWRRLQIDYDCPDRLLPRYARFLGELRVILNIQELSVTALASWIDSGNFKALTSAVDELVPMFYDLRPDVPADVLAGRFVPMVGAETCKWIDGWRSCDIPWRAGLGNLERLSLFAADGSIVGHLRDWSPEDLVARPGLEFIRSIPGEQASWRVSRDGSLRGTSLRAGQWLVWRTPHDGRSQAAVESAREAGAAGIVWFALPGPGLRAARSVPHVAELTQRRTPTAAPVVTVREKAVVLTNAGPGDLTAEPGGKLRRVWVDAGENGLFTSGPGRFFEMRAEEGVPIVYARRIGLSFPALPAGAAISSAPGSVNLPDGRLLEFSID
jgi:hypothetical protein